MRYFLFIIKPIAVGLYRKYREIQLKNLIDRGLTIGKNVFINRNVVFDHTFPFLIEIHDNCSISTGVRFMAHDATTFRSIGAARAAKVRILEGTFIGENAIILPGVTIGPRALIAAGAVVNRDIGEDLCAAGNPARPYGKFSALVERHCTNINNKNQLDRKDLIDGKLSTDTLRRLCDQYGNIYFNDSYFIDTSYHNLDIEALVQEHKDAISRFKRIKASIPQIHKKTINEAKGSTE